MVEVGLALVCALVAWSAAAALTVRYFRRPRLFSVAWLGAAVALMVALTAAAPASILEFSDVSFRLLHLGAALIGPLWATWGAIEFVARSRTARMLAREAVAVLTVVPLVILAVDPVSGDPGTSLPGASEHYQLPAMFALALVHTFVGVALLCCAGVLAHRIRLGSAQSLSRLLAVGFVIGSVIALILAARLGWGPMGQLLLIGAVILLWQASGQAVGLRAAAEDDDEDDEDHGFEDAQADYDHREDTTMRRRRERPSAHPAPDGPARGRRQPIKSTITIYTLHEGHGDAFDARMAEVVRAVQQHEPETMLFVSHKVAAAPAQRILYAMYRDDLAFEQHEQQPHVLEFTREAGAHIAAVNHIELAPTGGAADEAVLGAFALR